MGFQIKKLKSGDMYTNQFFGFTNTDYMTLTILSRMISTKIIELRSINEKNEEISKSKNLIEFLIKMLSERNLF